MEASCLCMKHSCILAAIVTYNPDVSLLEENLVRLLRQNVNVLIVDNASNNMTEIRMTVKKINDVLLIDEACNNGIGHALNTALDYAKLNMYTWLLTMDQDSTISDNFILDMRNKISEKEIGIIYPSITDKKVESALQKSYDWGFRLKYTVKKCILPNLKLPITSGSLINVSIATKIGGFCDELFIDGVDFDFALKMYEHGYSIVECPIAKLYHNLGRPNTRSIFGIKIMASGHSPQRCYYMNRNAWYLIFHHKKFWRWTLYNLFAVFLMGIRNAIVSGQYSEYLGYTLKGQYNGIKQLFQ